MNSQNKIKIAQIKKWLGSGSINIFGMPFSGKDTHGEELAKMVNGPLIGGGDIMRNASESPESLKKHIATGALAPKEEYLRIVLPYLSQDKFKNKPLILSSVGRWIGEDENVIKAASKSGHPIKVVIYLNIDESEAKKRWDLSERERHDDNAEHILEKRFAEFKNKTMPVVEAYEKKGLLINMDGMPLIERVTQNIINELHALATS